MYEGNSWKEQFSLDADILINYDPKNFQQVLHVKSPLISLLAWKLFKKFEAGIQYSKYDSVKLIVTKNQS